MTLTLDIPPEVEAKLRQCAAAEGQDAAAYASKLLAQAVSRPPLEDLLAPLRQQFASSGTTDDQLTEQITQARDAYRNPP